MGGIGSGARRSFHAGKVEEELALDIRALRRLGVVRIGECVIDTIRWSSGGLSGVYARLRTDLSDFARGGTLTISIAAPDVATTTQDVAIEMTPTPFGGHRCFFVCPISGGRCEALYYIYGRFGSRKAHRLSYAVQGMDALTRARRKAAKLRRRLKGLDNQPRPRGRNRIELAERLQMVESQVRTLYLDRLSSLVDRSGSQRMPRDRT